MSRPWSLAVTCLVTLSACGTPARDESRPIGDRTAGIARAELTTDAPVPRLVVRVGDASGTEPPVAELIGAWLNTGDGGRWLEVSSWSTEGDRFVARCQGPSDHDVRISVRNVRGPRLHVAVEDHIGVRVSLVELGIAWRLVGDRAPDEVSVPLLHADDDAVAGDAAFRSGIAFVRAGPLSLAVLPDLDSLSIWRRIPQALRVDHADDGVRILHSFASQRIEGTTHSARIRRDVAAGIRVRDEVIRLEHELHVTADARQGTTLAWLQDALWRERVAPELRRSALPFRDESWNRLVPAAVTARLARDLRTESRGTGSIAWLVDPDGSNDESAIARLGARRNQLRDALAALRLGARTGAGDLRETALRLAQFAILAPRRGGLTPHGYRLRASDRRAEWLAGDPDGPRPDAFDAADAAATAVLLMELSESLEEIRPLVQQRAADLARFLMASQRADGAIPGVYEQRYLTPATLEEDALAGATAGPAWFLCRFSSWTDDADVREAGRRAVRFVANRVLVEGGPLADPSLFRTHLRDPGSHAPIIDLAPAAAACLAAATLAEREPTFAPAVAGLADTLAELQQVWSPSWTGRRLTGGFGGSNADISWNAEGQATAARAMFDAYRLLREPLLLERGAAALRAALVEPSPCFADGSPPPDPLPLATAAASVAERCRVQLGQAVLDLDDEFALGIDAVWFEDIDRFPDRVRFRTLTHAPDVGPVEVTLSSRARVFPRLVHAAIEVVPHEPDRVTVAPRLVPVLTFRPPAIIAAPGEWWPEAEYLGPAPADGTAYVEVFEKGQKIGTIPLRDAGTGRLVTEKDPFRITVPNDGGQLHVRLVHAEDGRRVTVPADGLIDLRVGPMACIDPGDDLESTLVDSTPGARVVRFVDGRENAREAPAGESFSYTVPVPRDAASVELRILVSGALAVSSGPDGRALYADERAVPSADRVISLRLADPRLWPDGELELRFRPTGDRAAVARIEYRATGITERADAGPPRDIATPDVRLDLLVLPIGLGGAPAPQPELLRQALLGGADYRLTPEPAARPTVGSFARWITEISGGRTQVHAEILESLHFDAPAAELQDPATWQRLLREGAAALGAPARARAAPFDAIVIVHSGEPATVPRDLVVGATPVIALPEREPDGSYLSCGRIAHELLTRVEGLEPLGLAENGAFGELAVTAKASGHAPASPAGINLVRTGWAGIVDIGPQDDGRAVRLPTLLEGRTILRVTSAGLPGAGELFLETRPAADPPGAGLLVYRRFDRGEEPILATLDGRTVRPHVWRLSPSTASLRTPFVPATRGDLFRDTFRLDDLGPPSLATPRGETPWTLDRIETVSGSTVDLRFRWHGVDVLATARRGWLTGIGTELGPIPEDAAPGGPGRVVSSELGPVIELAPRDGAVVRGVFDGLAMEVGQRLFVRFDDVAGGRAAVQLAIGTTAVATTPLPDGASTIVADLPPDPSGRLVLTLMRLEGAPKARLAGVSLVPRAASAAAVTLPDLPTSTVRLMDGVFRGGIRSIRLDERGAANLRVPVLTPASHGALRVVCGAAHRTARGFRLRIRLRDAEGGEPIIVHEGIDVRGDRAAEAPLVVALCELPEQGERRLAFLEFEVHGDPDSELHLVTVEIDRP